MSYSPCCEPVPVPSPTAALGTLRAHGLRISTTRRRVVDALFAAEVPLSAEDITRGVGADAGRYVLASRLEGGYAACEHCGRHVALDDAGAVALRAAVRALCGFDC